LSNQTGEDKKMDSNPKKLVALRICSPQKNKVAPGFLFQIYCNPMLKAYFRKMKELKFPYAILSRKLGICMEGPHNTYYPDCEELSHEMWIKLLQTQQPHYADITFIYWNHRPLTHNKYINYLKETGYKIIEARSLSDYDQYLPHQTIQTTLIPIIQSNSSLDSIQELDREELASSKNTP
jgi:hypothetical protein